MAECSSLPRFCLSIVETLFFLSSRVAGCFLSREALDNGTIPMSLAQLGVLRLSGIETLLYFAIKVLRLSAGGKEKFCIDEGGHMSAHAWAPTCNCIHCALLQKGNTIARKCGKRSKAAASAPGLVLGDLRLMVGASFWEESVRSRFIAKDSKLERIPQACCSRWYLPRCGICALELTRK